MKLKKLGVILIIIIIGFPLIASEYINTYQGTGDDYIQIEKTISDLPAAMMVIGNNSNRYFAVTSYSATGDYIDLLVNTTEKYNGQVPIDLGTTEEAKYLEIKAVGAWSISVYPIPAIPKLTSEVVAGTGDSLLWIDGEGTMLAINGNYSERYFSVTAYDNYGNYNGLLVNTVDCYSGKVRLPKNSLILKISAVGDWSVKIQ